VVGVARRGTSDTAQAGFDGRRGDVGVHLGGPEHHHHGQGSTLFPKASSQMPTHLYGGTGRRELGHFGDPAPEELRLGGDQPLALLRKIDGGSRRRCAQASESLPTRALASPCGSPAAPAAARGRELRRRPICSRFSGGAASAVATVEPETGWIGSSRVDQREEDSGSNPAGCSRKTTATWCYRTGEAASAAEPWRCAGGVVARRGPSGDDKRATAAVTRYGC
jgi:hypothetical protein